MRPAPSTRQCNLLVLTAALLFSALDAPATDWPMWRKDPGRTAVTAEALPDQLHLRWTLDLPRLVPSYGANKSMQYDGSYEPVVAGKRLFVASSLHDAVRAYNTETLKLEWTFFADGPARFAPTFMKDRLYFVSDDGYLYCLQADSGRLLWRFRGAPADDRVLGNGRLVSAWPARGAPLVHEDTVYFGAGLWPLMGTFMYAVDAETGKAKWSNDALGAQYLTQPHGAPGFGGVTPHGYLAIHKDHLIVSTGRSYPAWLDRRTGELIHYKAGGPRGINRNWDVSAVGPHVFGGGRVYELSTGRLPHRATVPSVKVLESDAVYGGGKAFDLTAVEKKQFQDRRGRKRTRHQFRERWSLPEAYRFWLKAGDKLYGSLGTSIAAFQLSENKDAPPKRTWTTDVAKQPTSMLAADGRLFVVLETGTILCFGAKPPAAPIQKTVKVGKPQAPRTPIVNTALAEATPASGYAVLFGLENRSVLDDLIQRSQFQIVAIDTDAERVRKARNELSGQGVYGRRASVHQGDPARFSLPPYFASLVMVNRKWPENAAEQKAWFDRVAQVLNPYRGVAIVRMSGPQHEATLKLARERKDGTYVLRRKGDTSILTRKGGLPGAGVWTHESGSAANTHASDDRLVKGPLGVLWFGHPSLHSIYFDRHALPPRAQVINGRMFIEGNEAMHAVDIYTGRRLWTQKIEGLGRAYNTTRWQGGARLTGGNFASAADGIYVGAGDACLRLSPTDGTIMNRWQVQVDGRPIHWGYMGYWRDVLVGGALIRFDANFFADEFKAKADDYKDVEFDNARLKRIHAWLNELSDAKEDGKGTLGLTERDVAAHLNRMLLDKKLAERFQGKANEKAKPILARIQALLAAWKPEAVGALKALNRELLEAMNRDLPRRGSKYRTAGLSDDNGTTSSALVALNRKTGKELWQRKAVEGFRHNAIAMGNGRLYVIDRFGSAYWDPLKRRGQDIGSGSRLLALELRTGAPIWNKQAEVFGDWLGYSEEYDVLLQGQGWKARRLIAYRGIDGKVIWDRTFPYRGFCMIRGDTIITQADGRKRPGMVLDLMTGEPRKAVNPLTGRPIEWRYNRNYGCSMAIAGHNLVTFRSGTAAYHDLGVKMGTANLGGFRSSCTNSLIPAGGILSAPNFAETCSCAYQTQLPLALIHKPHLESWSTVGRLKIDRPVRRLGINLGAPGDRVDKNGTLWLEYPMVGGPSPSLAITTKAPGWRWFRFHSSRIKGDGPRWVAASGIESLFKINLHLWKNRTTDEKLPYTVRLHFTEPSAAKGTKRTFSVKLQKEWRKTPNILRASGGPLRTCIREYKNVLVGKDLEIALLQLEGHGTSVLCGIELEAEFPQERSDAEAWVPKLPPTPTAKVARVRVAPRVDGDLRDECWKHSENLRLRHLDGRPGRLIEPTECRLVSTTEALWISFLCYESRLHRLHAPKRARDSSVWRDHSVEVFLSPGNDPKLPYYQFVVNASGSVFDAYNKKKDWDARGLEVVANQSVRKLEFKSWKVEIKIPWSDLNQHETPKTDAGTWRLNLTRFRPGNLFEHSEDSAWSPTGSVSGHVPERFGVLELKR